MEGLSARVNLRPGSIMPGISYALCKNVACSACAQGYGLKWRTEYWAMSFEYFWNSIFVANEFMTAVVGVLTFAATFFGFGCWVGKRRDKGRFAALIVQNETMQVEIRRLNSRLGTIDSRLNNSDDYWLNSPQASFDMTVHRGQLSASIPIISVVNFKGGVGKTTICANLAGYFASRGKRVLLIDFDYQGSLSDTLLSHARIDGFTEKSQKLIEGREQPEHLRHLAERLSRVNSNLWLFPAFYGFSRTELQVMFRWLTGATPEIRYNLHNYLQSDVFQVNAETAFDIVLIDCPPRLLTGSVNALAASTHVLVPTILDGQSHVATLNTLGAIQQFRQNINSGLRTLGILPSLVAEEGGFNAREKHAIAELERQMTELHPLTPVLKERPIVRKELLAKAGGSELLYLSPSNDQKTRDIREMFDKLGSYIDQQVTWKHADAAQIIDLRGAYDHDRRVASHS
jgi:cellulose biosynthesis protein BcsQ